MKTIAFEKDGVIYTQVFTDENTVIEFDHITLENPPTEPNETWYIENDEIKIDQKKLLIKSNIFRYNIYNTFKKS